MKKIRYAVVGAGWISQEAFMPSVPASGNSEITAIVSGNMVNAKKLADFHGIKHIYAYEQYDDMLRAGVVDAVYIALPNSLHADYAIRAAKAGVHALVEKPLAISVEECEAMIKAADDAGVWLMTAYRMHNAPSLVEVVDLVRRGDIGDPRIFSSVFSFQIPATNHRLKAEHWGGALQDIGVYCINAARHVFGAEPTEVIAMTAHGNNDTRFAETEEMVCATLRFPGERIATFTASFGAALNDGFKIVGSTGDIEVSPAYRFEVQHTMRITTTGGLVEKLLPACDHFSGQAAYFSDCILNETRPESDGGEGLADVRIMLAIEKAAKTGTVQKISNLIRPAYTSRDLLRVMPTTAHRLVL
jgi:predicted dehydrogenase